MAQPERTFNLAGYRFVYQGREGDNGVYGPGKAYSFEYRVHDPRIGRFLSIDPLSVTYPGNSPYAHSRRIGWSIRWSLKDRKLQTLTLESR
jgi:hypothetical protein